MANQYLLNIIGNNDITACLKLKSIKPDIAKIIYIEIEYVKIININLISFSSLNDDLIKKYPVIKTKQSIPNFPPAARNCTTILLSEITFGSKIKPP